MPKVHGGLTWRVCQPDQIIHHDAAFWLQEFFPSCKRFLKAHNVGRRFCPDEIEAASLEWQIRHTCAFGSHSVLKTLLNKPLFQRLQCACLIVYGHDLSLSLFGKYDSGKALATADIDHLGWYDRH